MPRFAARNGAVLRLGVVLAIAAGCLALHTPAIQRTQAAERWTLTRALAKATASTTTQQEVSPPAPVEGLLHYDGFETGKIGTGWTGFAMYPRTSPPEVSDSIDVVTDPVRKGSYALKVIVQPEDAVTDDDKRLDKERCELLRVNVCRDGTCRFGDEGREGSDLWYAWSVLIPADYEYVSTTPYNYQIMGQWHDQPEPGATPTAKSPPISVHYNFSGAGQGIQIRYGLLQSGDPIKVFDAPIQKGRWVDLMFHIRFSQGSDGFLEVWKDGVMLTSEAGATRITGPNMWNAEPHYLRLGLYRGKGQTQTNTFYLDEVKIASSRTALMGG